MKRKKEFTKREWGLLMDLRTYAEGDAVVNDGKNSDGVRLMKPDAMLWEDVIDMYIAHEAQTRTIEL